MKKIIRVLGVTLSLVVLASCSTNEGDGSPDTTLNVSNLKGTYKYTGMSVEKAVDLNYIDEVVFAYGKSQGSATMGQATLAAIFKNNGIHIPIATVHFDQLNEHNAKNILVVTTISQQSTVQQAAPNAQLLVVDSLVTTPEYDKIVARMHK